MQDNSFFISKFKESVQIQINKLRAIKHRTVMQDKKLMILSEKLMKVINFNAKLDIYNINSFIL